jgi:YidC/Oxa1 family membrane protein insertase
MVAEISSLGGDITQARAWSAIPRPEDKSKNFVLFENGGKHVYLAQSGVIGDGLAQPQDGMEADGQESGCSRTARTSSNSVWRQPLRLLARKLPKTYVFQRNSYQVELQA